MLGCFPGLVPPWHAPDPAKSTLPTAPAQVRTNRRRLIGSPPEPLGPVSRVICRRSERGYRPVSTFASARDPTVRGQICSSSVLAGKGGRKYAWRWPRRTQGPPSGNCSCKDAISSDTPVCREQPFPQLCGVSFLSRGDWLQLPAFRDPKASRFGPFTSRTYIFGPRSRPLKGVKHFFV
jgi:hypothetical protein